MSATYDAEVGIVGGGPAGARAAELLAALGIDVVLWDPRAPWEKPCGGGLTAALTVDVPELAEILPRARAIDRVRITTDQSDPALDLHLDRPIHIIARHTLGEWQLSRARAAGARVVAAGVRRAARDAAGGWRVTMRDPAAATVRVRCLVGADGAASPIRTAVAPGFKVALEPTRVTYIGPNPLVSGESGGRGAEPTGITLRFERGVHGYAWDFPRPDHRSVGAVAAAGTMAGTRRRLDAAVASVATLNDAEWRGAVVASALYPMRRGYPEIGGADFALLGDAAGLADPATGEGIANALRSAALAAEAFAHRRTFARYGTLAAARFDREFRDARRLRALLYGRGYAVRLVHGAGARPSLRRISEALINGANEHRSFARQVLVALLAVVRARFDRVRRPG